MYSPRIQSLVDAIEFLRLHLAELNKDRSTPYAATNIISNVSYRLNKQIEAELCNAKDSTI